MASVEFDASYAERLAQRRAQIMDRVEASAAAVGRKASDIVVCAVSKTVDVPEVAAARWAGYSSFAENRPQELTRKLDLLRNDPVFADVAWHMIGNLQENKINHVLAERPALIHSIASPKLAEAVSKRAVVQGFVQPVLLEVNVSGEASKSGMTPDELQAAFPALEALPGIAVRGLMTMAPQGSSVVASKTFAGLRQLRDELRASYPEAAALTELSMGMSEDFQEAIAEGATIIRLGRVAFDPDFPLE